MACSIETHTSCELSPSNTVILVRLHTARSARSLGFRETMVGRPCALWCVTCFHILDRMQHAVDDAMCLWLEAATHKPDTSESRGRVQMVPGNLGGHGSISDSRRLPEIQLWEATSLRTRIFSGAFPGVQFRTGSCSIWQYWTMAYSESPPCPNRLHVVSAVPDLIRVCFLGKLIWLPALCSRSVLFTISSLRSSLSVKRQVHVTKRSKITLVWQGGNNSVRAKAVTAQSDPSALTVPSCRRNTGRSHRCELSYTSGSTAFS